MRGFVLTYFSALRSTGDAELSETLVRLVSRDLGIPNDSASQLAAPLLAASRSPVDLLRRLEKHKKP